MAFNEGKRVKRVEGIPVEEEEMLRDEEKALHERRVGKAEKKEEKKREKARRGLVDVKGSQGEVMEKTSKSSL